MTFKKFKKICPGNWSDLMSDGGLEDKSLFYMISNDKIHIRFYPKGWVDVKETHRWYKKKIWIAGNGVYNDFYDDIALIKAIYKKHFKLSNFI